MKLLVDTDIFLYRITAALETTVNWGNDLWTLWCDTFEARERLEDELETLGKKFESPPDDVILCMSDSVNWRKLENPSYKSNRKDTRKPIAFAPLKEWCVQNRQTVTMPHLEADDVLGILATENPGAIIVTTDKDMQTIPCMLFNPTSDIFPREISEQAADHWHMMQTLMGDPVDGYKGCPKYGPVTSRKLLEPVKTDPVAMWANVIEAFRNAGCTDAYAREQARMARICRASDWDHEGRRMTWEPPVIE